MSLLSIHGLCASVDDVPILRGVTLAVSAGETVALLGPNGSGKSTLAAVVMGHPAYRVTAGEVRFNPIGSVLDKTPEERARAGLFVAWQYPQSVAGVTLGHFLRLAYNATHDVPLAPADFIVYIKTKLDLLKLPHAFMRRPVNEGLSGGERKRAEMLQLAVLEPRLVILDETDSGLDVDGLRAVGHALRVLKEQQPALAVVLITHYQRMAQHIPVDRVAVMHRGTIVREGGPEILQHIERSGYAFLAPAAR